MTRQREAAIWREIGAGFERLLSNGHPKPSTEEVNPYHAGLCYAAHLFGLPSYGVSGSRVDVGDSHGPCYAAQWCGRPKAPYPWRVSASWRALSAYLIAEMIEDDAAWSQP